MVVFNAMEDPKVGRTEETSVAKTDLKLRRSRRLSSTRGLNPKKNGSSQEEATQDLNQKLGLCPIVSRTARPTLDRERLSEEWDFNEKVSLSSESSPRIDLRAGFELARDTGMSHGQVNRPKSRGSRVQSEIDVGEKRSGKSSLAKRGSRSHLAGYSKETSDENVIKSDSKYEIGIPVNLGSRERGRRQRTNETLASEARSRKMPPRVDRSKIVKAKIDKTNDSISKRLELIHELNQRILANYEKFHHKSKRSLQRRNSKESGDSLKRTAKRDPVTTISDQRTKISDGKVQADVHYSQVSKREERITTTRTTSTIFEKINAKSPRSKTSPETRPKFDAGKFTFSQDYCERLVNGCHEKRETLRKRPQTSDFVPKSGSKYGKPVRDFNENFSMAPKANFYTADNLTDPKGLKLDAKIKLKAGPLDKESEKPSKTTVSKTRTVKTNGSRFYLEIEPTPTSLAEEGGPVTTGIPKNPIAEIWQTSVSADPCEVSNPKSSYPGLVGPPEMVLERKILDDLNRTISRFDVEQTRMESSNENQSSEEHTESFSTDSIQSDKNPVSPSKSETSMDCANFTLETVNSSWDSGVGVDVGGGSGWVRVHTGIESSLVYLTLDTTARDVCRDMLLGEDLSLFIQYGGEPGRRLAAFERPLELQDVFLQRLGYVEVSRRARLGIDPELRHLISFHVGPSAPLSELFGYSHCGYVLVLKGLVFPQWKRRPMAVIGTRLFLYPGSVDAAPEWIELGGTGSAVCCAPPRLGKLVLRVTGYPKITNFQNNQREDQRELSDQSGDHHPETRHLYLGFHHPWDRDLWRGWLKEATQHPACPRILDLSKGGLSRVPDSAVAFPAIEELNLGQNQLGNPDSNLALLSRFPKLSIVRLHNNDLRSFPREILDLRGLTSLDLSGNHLTTIPPDIKRLADLEELTLDRNGVKELPAEVGELRRLRIISLVGNIFENLPSFLGMRALALTEVQGRPGRSKSFKEEKTSQRNLEKVNLRNNRLKGNIILGNYGNLTHLDVSENSIEKLDVSALRALRSVQCARNILTELTLCGSSLVSLIAGNNNLKKLVVEPAPINLEHLDISYNSLDRLPEWTSELPLLRALFASHNSLTALPERLLSEPSRLEVLHLPHNRLQALPPPRRSLNIVHLTLQGNALSALPENFLAMTEKLRVLNLSNNRLTELPSVEDNTRTNGQRGHSLEKLYVTGNCLTDTSLDSLSRLPALRVLHAAYNSLDTLPESCIASWAELEELVLSGNRLQYLPDNVANLPHLRVLRVHSNRLLTCPTFNKTTSLRVLDLAHNQLDRINLESLVPPQLQFLDISCNSRLYVDPRQFQVYRSQRPLSLVDVSGQNRSSLPSHPRHQEAITGERSLEQPWRLGFSETAGGREKLYVSQIRMPSFCNVEGLFGIFDGGSNQEAPSCLQEVVPRLLLEERAAKETSDNYLKYTLLSAHRELKEKGQKYGVDATLVHVTRVPSLHGYPQTSRRYSLKIATSGEAKAVLCRAAGPLILAPCRRTPCTSQRLGNAAMFPFVVPDPVSEEVDLEDDDEFVIIANRRFWDVITVQEAVRETRAEASPVLAAKRLQDLAQAYGAEDNLSILVLRLTGPGPGDLDQLMRELRHAVGKNKNQADGNGCACSCCQPATPHKPPAPCCCHVSNGYYLNGVLKNIVNSSRPKSQNCANHGQKQSCSCSRVPESDRSPTYVDDRSSPSGQSDQASDSTFKSRHLSGRGWTGSAASRASKARHSVPTQENGPRKMGLPEVEDTGSDRSGALSEEQFRCWEYMLEQNTQLLFDKELDTLTRSPLRRGQSRSTPQLAGNLPFVSKRFGSARTFNPVPPPRVPVRFGSGTGRRFLNGGPNAAYFGSLQRLMPYNLEYDFAVIQERAALDSLEQDTSRMQQYWGVATTEL